MGIPNIHTTIDYAKLIEMQANQVKEYKKIDTKEKVKIKQYTLKQNSKKRTK